VYYSFLGLDAAFVLPSIGIRPSRFITNNLHPQSSPYTINLGFASGTQLYQSSTPPTEKDLKELPPSQHSTIDRENEKEVSSIKLMRTDIEQAHSEPPQPHTVEYPMEKNHGNIVAQYSITMTG